MKHLSTEERVRLAEGPADGPHPHLAECPQCRDEVTAARALLGEAKAVEVPEPSPLFWQHFSARVSERLAAERPARRPAWRSRWRILVPLAVGAMGLMLAVSVHWRRPPAAQVGSAPSVSPVSAVNEAEAGVEDEAWTLLQGLAGDFDVETVGDSIGRPLSNGAESAVWSLSEAERFELGRLLSAEMPTAQIRSE